MAEEATESVNGRIKQRFILYSEEYLLDERIGVWHRNAELDPTPETLEGMVEDIARGIWAHEILEQGKNWNENMSDCFEDNKLKALNVNASHNEHLIGSYQAVKQSSPFHGNCLQLQRTKVFSASIMWECWQWLRVLSLPGYSSFLFRTK